MMGIWFSWDVVNKWMVGIMFELLKRGMSEDF